MLVLSRKNDEAVVIGGSEGIGRMVKVTVVEIRNGRVRLGFEADADVPVHRLEVWERICDETRPADVPLTPAIHAQWGKHHGRHERALLRGEKQYQRRRCTQRRTK